MLQVRKSAISIGGEEKPVRKKKISRWQNLLLALDFSQVHLVNGALLDTDLALMITTGTSHGDEFIAFGGHSSGSGVYQRILYSAVSGY